MSTTVGKHLEPAVIEAVLRMKNQESAVQRVLKCEAYPAVPKGENYLSTISRINMEVVLGNGRISHKNLILKEVPPERNNRNFVHNLGVFKIETDAIGFLMSPRQSCLDLAHVHLVLHSLGRFHAMSKILEERGIINGNDFKPYAITSDKNLVKALIHNGLRSLSEAMHQSWGSDWHRIADKLNMPLDVLQNKMLEIGKLDESRFNVLNHGDCWTNNMLFKYDWSNHPIAVRFVDFQVCHYNSPSWDVTYFMFTSIEPKVRREHFDILLKTYTNSLLSTLHRYHYSGRYPTHEEIAADMERIAFFRLSLVGVFHAIMTAEGTDAMDMEKVLGSEGSNGFSKHIHNSEIYKQRMGPELLKLEEQGLI